MSSYAQVSENYTPVLRAATGHHGGLYYLEVAGTAQLVRQVWAELAAPKAAERGRNQQWLDTKVKLLHLGAIYDLSVDVTVHYLTYRIKETLQLDGESKVRRNVLHYAYIHPALTKYYYQVLMGGSSAQAAPWFGLALGKLDLPILPAWEPVLWKEGLADGLLRALPVCVGERFWELSFSDYEWQELLTKLVSQGILQWQD